MHKILLVRCKMTKQGNNRTGCPYMSRKHKASKHKARRKGKEFEKSNVGQGFETRIVVVGAALDIDIRTPPARVEQQARSAQQVSYMHSSP